MGEYLVRVGKPLRLSKGAALALGLASMERSKDSHGESPTPDNSRFKDELDADMDEWRWPSPRDLHPEPGAVLCLKWKDCPDEYLVRVLDANELPGGGK